ncbi:MAG: carbon-nitrogen hydrolase family protein [Clostridiales Family XIII bacterium]|nr:carbon-nitrogen hydrolase family protein [Clostridiales Family XIII bacterium]
MSNTYKIALCQMMVANGKEQNMVRAAELVGEAARGGARVVCLPEIWNSPYDGKGFSAYAEPMDGPSAKLLADLARTHGIFLIGGSIPESGETETDENGKARIYNTSLVYNPSGALIAKHRKAHLFDVDIEKGIRFKESDFLSAGAGTTVFDTDFGKMGLAICFDVRFPEMFKEMSDAGAHLVFLPASFNMTTGPAHWDTLMKSRALDNQIYLAACSPARDLSAAYTSWGHSCVATPWGEYCAAADARENIVYAQIDIDYLIKIRKELPIGN